VTNSETSRATVSVLHGSFDSAGFALMIGVYEDEEMSGAERFLDRQFGQLLSGWQDLGRYPGGLGTSVFVEPGHDVAPSSEPVGAYLVGLGSSLTLGPRELRFAVYRALVKRCLRLYQLSKSSSAGHDAETKRVGVSTALLGVRDDSGLRTEDAVTAILEGVGDVNRQLREYEEGRGRSSTVRVGHVEFVERYAHRADLAAAAVRRAGLIAAVNEEFAELALVRVVSGDGALPAGATVLEQDRSWTRFSVTERAGAGGDGDSIIEVTALGREARADRATHKIDRASLDSLTSRLSGDLYDRKALNALRDRLIPHDLRAEFLASANLQLVLNERAAAYSWEQFTAPLVAVDGDGQLGTASILRAFAESGDRRLQPVRAGVGTALVIGAGYTTSGTPLTGAVEEAREVGALLKSSMFDTTLLTDDQGPLDVADLNIELLGDHQIVHLAGHGQHVEGDNAASGVLLARTFRFTADFVESMPTVPELVVLNSCYNARIGLSRLAAGLARSLMRIGVRAVVAAGWRIGDADAKAFAVSFHTDMLAGRTFGDAVARARRKAGSRNWAAYQCYGDPTFVLRGRPVGLNTIDDPVSLNDLQTRIETLLVQVADLSRRPDSSGNRQKQLVERLAQLEAWAGEPDSVSPEIRLRLGRTARELGEFDRAANWYSTFTTRTQDSGNEVVRPCDRSVPVDYLQQAANCRARAAQGRARKPVPTPSGFLEPLFVEAEAFAQGALRALADDEGAAILASVYKKWATCVAVGPKRAELLDKTIQAYDRISSTTRGAYGVENRIQIIAVRNRSEAATALAKLREPAPSDGAASEANKPKEHKLLDARLPRTTDFWARVAEGDRHLTTLMTATRSEHMRASAVAAVKSYLDAFHGRCTFAERFSSIDHLRDLWELLQDDDERKQYLRDCVNNLVDWGQFTPRATSTEPAATTTTTATTGTAPRESEPSPVRLTAVHAACGDCLRLDYTDDEQVARRILVDGGLGSAFDKGLGLELGPSEAPTAADVVVVTHVDRDHIEGVIRALERERLTATDYWFNGRDQIAPHTRSAAQGDALSELIPDDKRNRIVEGRALVVGKAGPPELALPGGATAVLLSPTPERLEKLLAKWPQPSRDADPVEALLSAFDEQPRRGPGQLGRDTSVSNGSSIAFLFEYASVSILFTGDAWSSVLTESIKKLLAKRLTAKLAVQLFKLSHHGSRQNVTPELLDLIEPERVLVCTDGSQYNHPDEDALELVRKHYPGVPIIFSDDTPVTQERAAQLGATGPSSFSPTIKLPPAQ